jgi:hypothetical protein
VGVVLILEGGLHFKEIGNGGGNGDDGLYI